MDLLQAMEERHSVRAYLDRPIEEEVVEKLRQKTEECNREGDLHFQLVTDEPKAFDCFLAHYGKFSNVRNYVALVAKKKNGVEEAVGYYGEKIALYAQTLGLNSCWVALTYKKIKNAFTVEEGEKCYLVLALGYGQTQGKAHKSKLPEKVGLASGAPEWFAKGIHAALLAPTAMNQQKFFFRLDGDFVAASAGKGSLTKVVLGIAKYHFELGANNPFRWA